MHDPAFVTALPTTDIRILDGLQYQKPVTGVNQVQERDKRRVRRFGIQPKDAKILSRPCDLAGCQVPAPAGGRGRYTLSRHHRRFRLALSHGELDASIPRRAVS